MRRFRAAVLLLLTTAAQAEPLRIAVISDLNGSYGSTVYPAEVADAVAAIIARPDLVISTGDMIAGQRADPKLAGPELSTMWQSFHAAVSDPLNEAGMPLLVTPGNHDASAYLGFEAERDAFQLAWADRPPSLGEVDAVDWPFRFAATVNGVLLVGMDATRSGPLADADMAWLRKVLEEAESHQTVILFGHLPLMPIAQGRENDVLGDPGLFNLARDTGVDLWLSGHHHAFYSGSAGGILFVAQGALGNGPRKLIGEEETSDKSFTWIEVEEDGTISVSALRAPDFATELAIEDLPPVLGRGPFALRRRAGLND